MRRGCVAQGAESGASCTWRDRMEGGKGRDICTIMADLHCCMAKTNTVLLKFIYLCIYIFFLIEKKSRGKNGSDLQDYKLEGASLTAQQ